MKPAMGMKELMERLSVARTITFIQAVDEAANQAGYIYRSVAPPRDVDSIEINMVKGAARNPITAQFTDYPSAAPRKGRPGLQVGIARIPASKQAIDITPEDLIRLFMSNNLTAQRFALDTIYDDRGALLAGLFAREEVSLIRALTTGKITLSEPATSSSRGLTGNFDYGVNSNRFKTVDPLWDDDNTDVIASMETEAEIFRVQNGFRPQVAIAGTDVIQVLIKHPKVQLAVFGTNLVGRMLSLAELNAFLFAHRLPVILEYTRTAEINTAGTTETILPAGAFVMLQGTVTTAAGMLNGVIGAYGTTDRGPTMEAISAFSAPNSNYPWPEEMLSGIYMRTTLQQPGEGSPTGTSLVSATTIPNLPLIDRIRSLTVLGS